MIRKSRMTAPRIRYSLAAWMTLLAAPAALALSGDPILQTESTDRDGDGAPDFVRATEYTYSGQGLLTRRVVSIDEDADKTPDERHAYSYAYDRKGKLIGWLHARDGTADGQYEYWHGKDWWEGDGSRHFKEWRGPRKDSTKPDYAEGWDRYDYIDQNDGTRNLSRITWFDRDGDGQPDLRKASQTHHDPESGRIVETNVGTDTDGSAPWEHFERRYFTYSKDGHAFDYVTDVIKNGMEYPGEWGGSEKTYDEQGNILDESVWKGIDDGATSSIRNWYEYEYDDAGRITYKTKSENLLGPPQPERWNSWTLHYHPNGRIKERINTGWHNKVIDMTNEINWENREVFDTKARLLSKTSVWSDIVLNIRKSNTILRSYDGSGRLVRVEETSSKRSDDHPQNRTIKILERNSVGRITEIRETKDNNADGVVDQTYRRVYRY